MRAAPYSRARKPAMVYGCMACVTVNVAVGGGVRVAVGVGGTMVTTN